MACSRTFSLASSRATPADGLVAGAAAGAGQPEEGRLAGGLGGARSVASFSRAAGRRRRRAGQGVDGGLGLERRPAGSVAVAWRRSRATLSAGLTAVSQCRGRPPASSGQSLREGADLADLALASTRSRTATWVGPSSLTGPGRAGGRALRSPSRPQPRPSSFQQQAWPSPGTFATAQPIQAGPACLPIAAFTAPPGRPPPRRWPAGRWRWAAAPRAAARRRARPPGGSATKEVASKMVGKVHGSSSSIRWSIGRRAAHDPSGAESVASAAASHLFSSSIR